MPWYFQQFKACRLPQDGNDEYAIYHKRGNSSKNDNINLKTFEVLQFFLCDYTRHIRNDILNTCTLKDKCYHPMAFLHAVGLDFSHMIPFHFLQHIISSSRWYEFKT